MNCVRMLNQWIRLVLSLVLAAGIVSARLLPLQAAPLSQSTPADWIQLSIKDIEAINVTNGEPVNDEMAAGAILASIHGIDKIDYVELGEFTPGVKKEYKDWILAEVPISNLTDVVQVNLSLVEMDPGGGKDLHLGLLALKDFELTKVAMLAHFLAGLDSAAAAQSRQINASSPSFESLLGAALVAGLTSAFASIINTLWSVIVGIIADDPFKPISIPVPALADLKQGAISGQITVEDQGGKYQISYTWSWVAKPTAAAQADAAQASTASPAAYQPDYSFAEAVNEMRTAWNNRLAEKIFLPTVFKR